MRAPGVTAESVVREPPKGYERTDHADVRNPETHDVGLQRPCGVHSEISTQDALRPVAAGFFLRSGIPGFGRAKGMHSGRGASDARTRPPDVAGAAAVCGIKRDGVHQRQECDPHRTGVGGTTKEFCRPAFFGTGVSGVDGRQERGCRASLYPRPGEGRSTSRTTGTEGAWSASR